MSKKLHVSPTADTEKNQQIAGSPKRSVWVSANAGSGKTHILTLRVLRILLSGVAPENILCLTYTKAAAAEMKNRVAAQLSEWALLDDDNLTKTLAKISNAKPGQEQIARARTLFALALETPGGLKISTIHAFCEAALHRFPLEADVPVDFSVIEDVERANLILDAQNHVLASGLNGDPKVCEAVANLFLEMSDGKINSAIGDALGQIRELRTALEDPEQTKSNLRKLLDAVGMDNVENISRKALADCNFDAADSKKVFEIAPPDPERNRFEDKLSRIDWQNISLDIHFKAFLTGKGKIPKTGFPKKSIQDADPELAEKIIAHGKQLELVFLQIHKARLLMRSEAMLDVIGAILTRYEIGKATAGRLDFDDLIIKFENLLVHKTSSDWVRYKLDAGMTHILVDESQDTNPDQWRVVKLLVDDFFSGESAAQASRTIFGVGDEKQSIFGFQGAEPALFGQTGQELERKADKAGKLWENVRFPASFRTQENILNAVDLVCARPDIREALLSLDNPVAHESARVEKGGSITLWPPINIEKSNTTSTEWLTTPAPSNKGVPRLTAERIATQIKHWIDTKRAIGTRQQAVTADDILILVQTRSPIFHEIIRALKNANIATPGADRLSVTKHIVVTDLLALGDIMLNKNDDLALGALLCSPLFGVTIEQLQSICAERKARVSVWQSLHQAAKKHLWANQAFSQLVALRKNLDRARPFEFFAELLFSHGGLKKFHARFGEEIDEIIDVFLDLALEHENSSQPSLQGFLASLRAREVEVKRELSEKGGGVRVMSVHGAKGLEAPIVILADASKKPQLRRSVFISTSPETMFVHASKETHTEETIKALYEPAEEKETREYWRKLYVAMTRAEDELYVTGVRALSTTELKDTEPQPSWYGAIETALQGQTGEVDIVLEEEKGFRFPANLAGVDKTIYDSQKKPEKTDWEYSHPLKPVKAIETIRPSTAYEESLATTPQTTNTSDADAEEARKLGTALHELLEHLAPIEDKKRARVAANALLYILPEKTQHHADLVKKALSIFNGADSAFLFGPNSRAELPMFVFGKKKQSPVQIIGRIDRIIEQGNTITLVDFKSNAIPPANASQLAQAYKTQMGLYLRCGQKLFVDSQILTAIYWTNSETLMTLNNDDLLEATKEFNIT